MREAADPEGQRAQLDDQIMQFATRQIGLDDIPAVEEGVIEALKHGPLGFPVVDLTVIKMTVKSTTGKPSGPCFNASMTPSSTAGMSSRPICRVANCMI